MSKITGKVNYKEVLKGDTGYTFEPHVTVDGILYWTNNGNLENPLPVNLHGKQGFMFIPHVDNEGNLSWTNTGELENPPTVNIKGDKGYFYTPHISQDGILTWSNNGDLENPQPFNISDLILNEVKESRVDTTGKTFTKLKERLDSDFKKLSESIKNNDTKDEVVQARTATTGENFMTLDDRIDHEVMRLREKIEVTMLEQEDKENHVIGNTVDGMTTDMVIKGRTLNNLLKDKIDFISSSNSPHTGQKKLVFDTSPNKPFTFIADIKYTGSLPTQLFVRGNKSDGSYVEFGSIDVANNFSGKIVCVCKQNIEKGCSSVLIGFRINSDNSTIKNAMILEGDYTNKPIPQYFEGIKSFGQHENKISILSHGKNLFATEFEMGTLIDGNISYESAMFRTKDFIRVNGGTNYIFSNSNSSNSIVKVYYDENKKWINDDITRKNSFTTPSNCGYVKLRSFLADKQLDWINASYMLEEGTQATSYQPYKEDKKDILIKESLRSVGNISDILYEDNGQVKINRYVKEYTFTGDESITKENTLINITRFYIDTQCKNEVDTRNIICNNFNSYGTWWDRDEIGMYWDTSIQGRLWFHIPKTEFNDVESFKNFLKANPTTIIYELNTPTIEVVEDFVNIDLKTFNEKTYVSFENAIKGTSSFKVPVNTNKLINDLKFEKEDLKEKFNNLNNEFENFKTYMIQTLPYKGV